MDPGRRSASATGGCGDVERNGRIRLVPGGLEDLGRVEVGTASRRHPENRGSLARRRRGRGTCLSAPAWGHPRRWIGWGFAFLLIVISVSVATAVILLSFRTPGTGAGFVRFFPFGSV